MKKSIGLFLCLVVLVVSNLFGGLEEIIEQSRLLRTNLENSPEIEEKRKTDLLAQVSGSIAHYGSHVNFYELVEIFLKDALKNNEKEFLIIDSRETSQHGRSDDFVFFIMDQEDCTLSYIVKVFNFPKELRSGFLPEISALDFLIQLSLPSALPVHPLFAGLGAVEGAEYGLLLESVAIGKRLDSYVKQIGKDSEKRLEALEDLKRVLAALARVLAELHAFKSNEPHPLQEKYLDKLLQNRDMVLADSFILQSLEERLDLSAFDEYLLELLEKMQNALVFHSYQHGAPHLANTIYEENTDKIYLIDVAYLHETVGLNDEPIGNGVNDLIRVEENLMRIGINILSEEEMGDSIHFFRQAYEEAAQEPIDQLLLKFNKAIKKLSRLIKFSKYPEIVDEKERILTQTIFEEAIKYFEKEVKM